jgi:cyclomaltodextrinase / maltogenic alpha-amylase / neopullulanase
MKRTRFLIKSRMIKFLAVLAITFLMIACTVTEKKQEGVKHPAWLKDATLYEVNIRQFTPEGTFNAFSEHLQSIKDMGVDIIWLMPVNPIGEKNRKGPLGSYYSVKDYYGVNPEFGTMDDFRAMVTKAHKTGLKVIIDWVPNHSSWDNPLTVQHPEYYQKDSAGNFTGFSDWTDVILFDYSQPGLRQYMIDALKFWLKETDIDGFRFDVAHMIPVSFWNTVRPALNEVKEVFMLAESDQPFLNKDAFDATYDWKLHHIMNEVAKGKMDVTDIDNHFAYVDTAYPANSILMEFTSNHDENSWNGTEYERLGDAVKTFAVFTYTIPGMPLIYNGQEVCMQKRLRFFDRDTIPWNECDMREFYKTLNNLKADHEALFAGSEGGKMVKIKGNHENKVYAFFREYENSKIMVILNFSAEELKYKAEDDISGMYTDAFSGEVLNLENEESIELKPWAYKVFISEE